MFVIQESFSEDSLIAETVFWSRFPGGLDNHIVSYQMSFSATEQSSHNFCFPLHIKRVDIVPILSVSLVYVFVRILKLVIKVLYRNLNGQLDIAHIPQTIMDHASMIEKFSGSYFGRCSRMYQLRNFNKEQKNKKECLLS